METMKDTLLLYYSFEGNTKYAAERLAAYMEMDVERLVVDKEPPKTGIAKFIQGGKSALRREDPGLHPIKSDIMAYYDIIIAFPVWAVTYPPAIDAFFKAYPFVGKNVYLVVCSAGGNTAGAIDKASQRLKGNTILGTLSLKNPLTLKKEAEAKIVEFVARRN